MKVTRRYNQHRRDLRIDMECEGCGAEEKDSSVYDDANFWVNVVPNFKCKSCGKSSNDLGVKVEDTHTMYPEGFQV